MKTFLTRLSILGLLLALASVFVLGQAISGDLTGTVRDGSGAVLPNVSVDVTNLATGFKTSQPTTGVGEFHFVNLPVGHYKISVTANSLSGGYSDVEVQLNKTATANITAQVAGAGTTVEVTGQTASIDTSTAQLQSTYELKQTQDLPSASVGLGVLNLALLDPGVASSGGIGVGVGPSVSGQRPRNNNFTVEGVDNNSKAVTGPVVTIPNDAVQNFTVLQNQFSAEFGHSSGGQFNQTIVSGTNHFHGRLYDYLQNRNMNGIDAATARVQAPGPYKNEPYTNDRAAGQIGGPIFKDKLFFFTNQEYNWIGQKSAGYYACAPTALGYTQIATLPNPISPTQNGTINPNNLAQYQKYVGAAAAPDTSGVCGNAGAWTVGFDASGNPITAPYEMGLLDTNGSFYNNTFTSTNSIDWNISDKDQVRGRWVYQKNDLLDTAANLPSFWTVLPVRNTLVTLSEYHNFTPSLNNELRLGFNRNTQYYTVGNQTFPGLDQFPNLQINDMQVQVGPDGNAPQFGVQNIYQATDNISWLKGKHNFKFGIEGRKYISPQGFTQRARGDYEYTTFQNYLNDLAPDYFGERSVGSITYYGDQSAIYVYGADQWKINSHLSLDLGMRYEFTSVPFSERLQNLNAGSSVPGLINFNTPQPQYGNFAPRVGFAYSPGTSGNTSIRGGFGIAYDVLFDNLGLLSSPPQFQTTCDVGNPVTGSCNYNNSGTNFLSSGGILPGGSGFGTFPNAVAAQEATGGFVPKQQLPYTETWNLGIQHVFANKYTAEVRYVGTRGIHLPVQDRINRQSVVTPTNFLPTYLTAPSQATLDALPGLSPTRGNFVPAYVAGCGAGPIDPVTGNPTDLSPCFASNITSYQPYGKSLYHGLQTQFSRSFTNGLQFQAAWTWSHAWDDSTAEVFSTQLTPRRPQDSQNVHADYGTSALDRRHRVTLEVLYDVQAFKNSNWLMKNVVGNWEIAPVYTFQSPEYWTAQSGTDSNLNGDSAPDRTIVNPAGVPGTGSTVSKLLNSSGAVVAYLANDPTAEYIQAGKGALANAARNTVALPHINNWDLTAVKRIGLTEHTSFEFQAQALNVFNHSQYVAGTISTVNTTAYTAITPFVTVSGAHFNDPKSTFSNNPRTMQLAAKFIF
jgi:hypothetical protein